MREGKATRRGGREEEKQEIRCCAHWADRAEKRDDRGPPKDPTRDIDFLVSNRIESKLQWLLGFNLDP